MRLIQTLRELLFAPVYLRCVPASSDGRDSLCPPPPRLFVPATPAGECDRGHEEAGRRAGLLLFGAVPSPSTQLPRAVIAAFLAQLHPDQQGDLLEALQESRPPALPLCFRWKQRHRPTPEYLEFRAATPDELYAHGMEALRNWPGVESHDHLGLMAPRLVPAAGGLCETRWHYLDGAAPPALAGAEATLLARRVEYFANALAWQKSNRSPP